MMSEPDSILPSARFWRGHLSNAQPTRFPSALNSGGRTNNVAHRSWTSRVHHDHGGCKVSDSTLIAAWVLVVSLHTLSDDIVLGLSLEHHGAVRTFPFRVQVSDGGTSISTFINSVQSSLDEIFAHLDQWDDVLGQISQIDSNCREACNFTSHLEIFSSRTADENTESEQHVGESAVQACPLFFKCLKSTESVGINAEVDTTIYTQQVSQDLLEQFRSAITVLSSGKDTRLDDVDLVSNSALEQLERWTSLPEPTSTQPFLHKVVEEQAHMNPLAIAAGETESVMTYGELDEGASALARHLSAIVAKTPGNRVGNVAIFFSKSAFAILSMLAILKAGGAFVPIDVGWPARRIETIFTDAKITTVLCSEDQQARLQQNSVTTIMVSAKSTYELKKSSRASNGDGDAPLEPPLLPSDPAYIIYTSGSTGKPKGVEISHLSITTSLNAMARYFKPNSSTRTLQFNAYTFDVSMADVWLTLSRGGRLCVPSEDERFALDDFIEAERPNFAFVTPSIASTIDPAIARRHLLRLSTIGESPSPGFLRRFARRYDDDSEHGLVLGDTWGPTEASVVCTGSVPFKLDENETLLPRAGNIGRPFGCSLFIVSPQNPHFLSPAYAPGELALVGPTLATGYFGDEAKTNEAFRTDLAWSQDPRWKERLGEDTMARVYLTGDIGRFSETGDGSVIFMHRRGGYVKINGFRVEPKEVETGIADVGRKISEGKPAAPSCDHVAVCVFERAVDCTGENSSTQQVLACFIANGEGGKTGDACETLEIDGNSRAMFKEVAKGARDIIPEYMMPKLFVPVSKLPYSTSSKLDRKALLGLLDKMDWNSIAEKYAIETE